MLPQSRHQTMGEQASGVAIVVAWTIQRRIPVAWNPWMAGWIPTSNYVGINILVIALAILQDIKMLPASSALDSSALLAEKP